MSEVIIESTREGLYVRCGNKRVGPFKNTSQIDLIEASKVLGVEPKDILLAKWKTLSELLPGKGEVEKLIYKEDNYVVEVKADDGVMVSPALLYYKLGDTIIIGEFFLSYSTVIKGNDTPTSYESIEPFIVWALHKGGSVERDWKPLRFVKSIMVGDKPITVEKIPKLESTIPTFIRLNTVKNFLNGGFPKPIKDLFEDIKKGLRQYINFCWDERLYDLVSCWIIASYFFGVFPAFPFLYFYGSQGCGKTRAGLTVTLMSRHGFKVIDPSDASLYRLAQAIKPTMLIDESLLGLHAWRIIRSAFKRGFQVPRVDKTSKESFIISLFETFMPVVFASTKLPSELGGEEADEARAIIINMQQAKDPSGEDPEPEDFADIRDNLYLSRMLLINEVLKSFQEIKTMDYGFYGHEREVWLPIFTIANIIGKEVLKNIEDLAIQLHELKSLMQYKEERILLMALSSIMNEQEDPFTFNASMLIEPIKQVLTDEGEYDEYTFPKIWKVERIGRILTKMGIYKRRTGKRREYIITKKQMKDLLTRYKIEPLNSNDSSDGCDGYFEKGIISSSDSKTVINVTDPLSKNSVTTVTTVTKNMEKCSLCQCFQEKYSLCLMSGLKTSPNDVCDKFMMRSEKVEKNDQTEDQNHDRGEVYEAERHDQVEVQGDTQILVDEDLRRAVEYLNMYRSVGRLRFEMDLEGIGVKDPKVVLE
ncbi:MAG: hypothetical protein QXI93_04615, partial [Candidatus Methanomethylicia archaeon]